LRALRETGAPDDMPRRPGEGRTNLGRDAGSPRSLRDLQLGEAGEETDGGHESSDENGARTTG